MNVESKQENLQKAAEVVTKIFDAANSKQFLRGLDYYSDQEDAFFVSGGVIHSLEELRTAYVAAGATVEDIHNEILEWHALVLGPKLVSFTLPIKLRLKLNGVPEYTGELIWSGVLQEQDGQWLVVQSHESWFNAAEVATALTPSS